MPRRGWALAWHPLVLAVWPVVELYRDNVDEVPVGEALAACAVVAGAAAVLLIALALLLRDARRAALVTSVVAVIVMAWGAARDAAGDPGWLPAVWVGAGVVLIVAFLRAGGIAKELTRIMAAVSVVAVSLAAVPLLRVTAPLIAASRIPPAPTENLDELVGTWSAGGEPRDIFYLVFDRYGSQASMEERFGMDLSAFFDGLRERGFRVAPDSKANHLRTAQSLSSTFNLRYHHDLARRYGPDTGNLLPVYDLLQRHAVGRLLKDRGYEYVHIGAWWDPTAESPLADVNDAYETRSDFELALFRTTLVSYFERRPQGRSLAEQSRRVPYDGALRQFQSLRRAAARPGPTFTFAHVLLPHEPFVFEADGDYVDRATETSRSRERNYMEQTEFTNRSILALLDDILDVPVQQRPIIILAADEGPHPVRFKLEDETFDWTTATDAELREKMSILNAYLLPGADGSVIYDDISPVNTWRVLFNTYFDADLPLLEDRSYVFRDESHVYDFTDVTERLR